jgi:hypothetical protein
MKQSKVTFFEYQRAGEEGFKFWISSILLEELRKPQKSQ